MLTMDIIRRQALPLAVKYKVKRLEVFGSYADGTSTESSDVDFLAEFAVPVPSIFAVMGFREELSMRLNKPVDVVTLPISHPERLLIQTTERIL
ncbi:hypothetical protein FACS18948_2630 [Clostridia bacterium]|nr:hypothetical protein FACS18948_2630 [Clostridia bacterium]